MLGNRSVGQTQHYARIQDFKVSEDMALLKIKLEEDQVTESERERRRRDREFARSF